ncbi:hypothetical protein [Halarcobacter sp.]|uniref:hypothetical protein n=1 Tax=Halarcobacter sp. TaxID=2321133 RepID=UPI002AAA7FA4|nr:hypothetical protein [Halarcobacter sp.]
MHILIARLLSWFGAGGVLLSFFSWIGKKITAKGILLPFQFAVVGLLFVHRMALLTAFITLVVYIYNGIVELLEYINTTIFSSVFAMPVQILQSIGFFQAVNDVFSTFSFLLVSLLVMYVTKAIVQSIQTMSDEFFKISMMISV